MGRWDNCSVIKLERITEVAKNETYEEFVNKFVSKKTTDDCYTPENIYNVISDWVAKEYNLDKSSFVRPFYPGGNYKEFDYNGKIVVDNPPFSILAKIIDFYIENNIKFFLFAPTLTLFYTTVTRNCTSILIGESIIYDNGAVVNTSFITNLEPKDIRIRTVPELYQGIQEVNKLNKKGLKKVFPKYEYSPYVITPSRLYPEVKGVEITIMRDESEFVNQLDSQKEKKKKIYGGGYLISENAKNRVEAAKRKAAKRKAAEHNQKECWELSDRELDIIKHLR